MGFNIKEKQALLLLKGVGPTVIKRFEEIGINSFQELKRYEADEVAERVASMLNTTCWKNSPQSKSTVSAAIALAKNNDQ